MKAYLYAINGHKTSNMTNSTSTNVMFVYLEVHPNAKFSEFSTLISSIKQNYISTYDCAKCIDISVWHADFLSEISSACKHTLDM